MRRVALMIGYMVIAAGFAVALTLIWPFLNGLLRALSPFIVALIVAYLFNPIVTFAQVRLRVGRIGGIVVVNLLILLVAAVFIAIILPILAAQIRSAWSGIESFTTKRAVPYLYQQLNPEDGSAALAIPFLDRFDWRGVLEEELGAEAEDAEDAIDEAEEPAVDEADLPTVEEVTFEELVRRGEAWLLDRGITPQALFERFFGTEEGRTAATTFAAEGADVVAAIIGAVARAVVSLIGSIMFLVFAGLVSFYLLVDFGKVRGLVEVMVPGGHRERFFDVALKVDRAVGGFIRGQLICAATVGVLTTLGLSLLGMKQYALLIGCLAGAANIIPYLGPVIGALPAVLYMLVVQDTAGDKLLWAGLVIGVFAVIQLFDSLVMQPKVIGQNAQLHPAVVILALALGANFGLIGMIVAVPIAASVRVLIKEFYWDAREDAWRSATGHEGLEDAAKEAMRKGRGPRRGRRKRSNEGGDAAG